MFAYIKGNPVSKSLDYIVLDVNGIGYKVFVPLTTAEVINLDMEQVLVHTHLYVREDNMTLYGFATVEDLLLFEMLLGVSGIGPKVALSILSRFSSGEFYSGLLTEDVKLLTTIPGVGNKTAKRLILELKDKVSELASEISSVDQGSLLDRSPGTGPKDSRIEAIEALQTLGYDYSEALSAIKNAKEQLDTDNVEALIKQALKSLAVL